MSYCKDLLSVSSFLPFPHIGVNSRGLILNQLLQMDTHVFYFRKIKYAHVTIDTFLVFLITTALTRKATKSIVACVDFFLNLVFQIKLKLAITAKHLRYFINNLMLSMLLRFLLFPRKQYCGTLNLYLLKKFKCQKPL